MRVLLLANNGKEKGLAAALETAGVEFAPGWSENGHFRAGEFDVLLVDYPQGWGGLKLAVAQAAHEQGKLVCSYPHGAGVLSQLDGIIPPCPYVDVELVPAWGHTEVYKRMGYPTRCELVGWYFCDQQPFRKFTAGRKGPEPRLLFAPAHPFSGTEGRTFVPTWQEANRKTWEQFVKLPGWKTVHLYGTWEANGFEPHPDVEVSESTLDPGLALERIDQADLVVGDPETFARLAVARGKPTVMFGQDIRPHSDLGDREIVNWSAWRLFASYPFDTDTTPLADAVNAAFTTSPETWRDRFIGQQTDPQALRALLERLLAEKTRPNREQRRRTRKRRARAAR